MSRTPIDLPVGGQFRSTDILGDLGAPVGSFGPITVESTNRRLLSAISRISNTTLGLGAFWPPVNLADAWTDGVISEVADTGDSGFGTLRTNLGVNNVTGTPANATIVFFNSSGTQLGSTSIIVPGNGLVQLNHVIRLLLNSATLTGLTGYLRISSDQPIHAWASLIDNGSNVPYLEMGFPAPRR